MAKFQDKERILKAARGKKEIETINKSQEEMKNTISELKNTVEGIKSRPYKQRIGSVNWRTR